MSTAKPGATITLTRIQREKEAKAAQEVLAKAKPRATISLFGITFGEEEPASMNQETKMATRKAPRGVPTIGRWRKNRDGSVTGFITGSPNFSEGERITTSPIASGAVISGSIIRTGSGSKYFLE